MITQHEKKLAGCRRETVRIPCGNGVVDGDLEIPSKARAIVLFVHGRGSNRFSHCNQLVARILRESGIGTLFFDSLTPFEQTEDEVTSRLRFDIEPLTDRLVDVTNWLMRHVPQYSIGYFCSSTGLAAALLAAAELGKSVNAIVSRRGRPDLAADALPHVLAPTLLIIGQNDGEVIRLNERAFRQLTCPKSFSIIPSATRLFEEPGALEEVARMAAAWFQSHLTTHG